MSLDLKFYECKAKDCNEELLAGEYCISCAKAKRVQDKVFGDTKSIKDLLTPKPYIGASFTQEYDNSFGTASGTTALQRVSPTPVGFWTNFNSAGNATSATGSFTLSDSTTVDFRTGSTPKNGQGWIYRAWEDAQHK